MTTEYLIELIQKSVRVILPEFGAFLIKDDGSGSFKPQNLTFSPFLKYNDGMLEDNLAKDKSITKEQAKQLIVEYIESIKKDLKEKGSFELNDMGQLYVDQRGSVLFKLGDKPKSESEEAPPTPKTEDKSETVEDTPEEPVKEEVLQIDEAAEAAEEKKEEPKEEKIEESAPTVASEAVVPVKEEPELKEEKKEIEQEPKAETKKPTTEPAQKKGIGGAVFRGILLGLLVVVLIIGSWFLYNKGFFTSSAQKAKIEIAQSREKKAVDKEKTEDAKVVEDEEAPLGEFDEEYNQLIEKMEKSSLQDEELPAIEPQQTQRTPSTQSSAIAIEVEREGLFHIIAGSFRNASYAEKLSNDMSLSGFQSKVIVQPSGMHTVTLGSFSSREEAADSMNVWKSQHPNIWILHQ